MTRSRRLVLVALVMVAALGVFVAAQGREQLAPGVMRGLAASGRTLRDWDDRLLRMERTRELRLRSVQVDTMIPGRRHERLQQYYRGVPVFGGEAVRETDGSITLSVTSSLYTGVRVDPTPRLSEAEALDVFRRATGLPASGRDASELTILPRSDGTFALTYRITGTVKHRIPVVFVNAHTGLVELRYDNLRTQQAAALTGVGVLGDTKKMSATLQGSTYVAYDQLRPVAIRTFDLKGDPKRTDLIVNGLASPQSSELATTTANHWQDGAVVDAHTYLGWVYDYFFKRHNWHGFDNRNGRAVFAIVHPVRRADIETHDWDDVGDYYLGAFFCPLCGLDFEDLIVFAEGLPPNYYTVPGGQHADYSAGALDLVAHEYTHGVSFYTANLIYQRESGALDEAFSDIMATGVEFFFQTAGTGTMQADYLHAEDVYRPFQPGSLRGIRDLSNPESFGDPDHYTRRYTGEADNFGVHTNCTIVSHAFYLAVEGGTNRTSGLSVQGVGAANREQMERVFFRAFITLPSSATFTLARAKTIQTARDLYGANSAAERAVTQAWTAVGVQ